MQEEFTVTGKERLPWFMWDVATEIWAPLLTNTVCGLEVWNVAAIWLLGREESGVEGYMSSRE